MSRPCWSSTGLVRLRPRSRSGLQTSLVARVVGPEHPVAHLGGDDRGTDEAQPGDLVGLLDRGVARAGASSSALGAAGLARLVRAARWTSAVFAGGRVLGAPSRCSIAALADDRVGVVGRSGSSRRSRVRVLRVRDLGGDLGRRVDAAGDRGGDADAPADRVAHDQQGAGRDAEHAERGLHDADAELELLRARRWPASRSSCRARCTCPSSGPRPAGTASGRPCRCVHRPCSGLDGADRDAEPAGGGAEGGVAGPELPSASRRCRAAGRRWPGSPSRRRPWPMPAGTRRAPAMPWFLPLRPRGSTCPRRRYSAASSAMLSALLRPISASPVVSSAGRAAGEAAEHRRRGGAERARPRRAPPTTPPTMPPLLPSAARGRHAAALALVPGGAGGRGLGLGRGRLGGSGTAAGFFLKQSMKPRRTVCEAATLRTIAACACGETPGATATVRRGPPSGCRVWASSWASTRSPPGVSGRVLPAPEEDVLAGGERGGGHGGVELGGVGVVVDAHRGEAVLNAVSMRRRTSASRARPPPRRDSMAELVPESRAPPS